MPQALYQANKLSAKKIPSWANPALGEFHFTKRLFKIQYQTLFLYLVHYFFKLFLKICLCLIWIKMPPLAIQIEKGCFVNVAIPNTPMPTSILVIKTPMGREKNHKTHCYEIVGILSLSKVTTCMGLLQNLLACSSYYANFKYKVFHKTSWIRVLLKKGV